MVPSVASRLVVDHDGLPAVASPTSALAAASLVDADEVENWALVPLVVGWLSIAAAFAPTMWAQVLLTTAVSFAAWRVAARAGDGVRFAVAYQDPPVELPAGALRSAVRSVRAGVATLAVCAVGLVWVLGGVAVVVAAVLGTGWAALALRSGAIAMDAARHVLAASETADWFTPVVGAARARRERLEGDVT